MIWVAERLPDVPVLPLHGQVVRFADEGLGVVVHVLAEQRRVDREWPAWRVQDGQRKRQLVELDPVLEQELVAARDRHSVDNDLG